MEMEMELVVMAVTAVTVVTVVVMMAVNMGSDKVVIEVGSEYVPDSVLPVDKGSGFV